MADRRAGINYQSSWYTEYKMIENHYVRLNTALTRGKTEVKNCSYIPPYDMFLRF